MKQEELLTQKCRQDLNLSEELQKTCSAKLNDSESRINESQLTIGYEIASSAIVISTRSCHPCGHPSYMHSVSEYVYVTIS